MSKKNGSSRFDSGGAETGRLPQHVAIIMDGNGRWARSRMLPRVEGHRAGAKTVRMVVEESRRLGIRYLTLFAFSTENWDRPADEVSALMRLFEHYLKSELELLLKNDIRLRAMGEISRLPQGVQTLLRDNELRTAQAQGMDLILAVSYGGREEMLHVARQLAEQVRKGELEPAEIDVARYRSALYLPGVPDPDLLIRTSAENRISNFLLWQLAYAEIVVSPVFWPQFDQTEYARCLSEYTKRVRRFGLTDAQIERKDLVRLSGS